jgi:hypothetical protein
MEYGGRFRQLHDLTDRVKEQEHAYTGEHYIKPGNVTDDVDDYELDQEKV